VYTHVRDRWGIFYDQPIVLNERQAGVAIEGVIVQRAIHQGKIPVELTRHRHSMMAVSSALTLLTNAVMAWNTQHMQRALDTIEKLGNQPVLPEHLRSIAPTSLEGINLRGTFDFPIANYVHRLMPSLMVAASSPSQRALRFRRRPSQAILTAQLERPAVETDRTCNPCFFRPGLTPSNGARVPGLSATKPAFSDTDLHSKPRAHISCK
jgi:Tn3 transposase DDE domain